MAESGHKRLFIATAFSCSYYAAVCQPTLLVGGVLETAWALEGAVLQTPSFNQSGIVSKAVPTVLLIQSDSVPSTIADTCKQVPLLMHTCLCPTLFSLS